MQGQIYDFTIEGGLCQGQIENKFFNLIFFFFGGGGGEANAGGTSPLTASSQVVS